MSWRGGIKRTKYDALFSYLVRERVNWVCEYCHRDFKHNHGGLHCSHLFGRRGAGTRCHPRNAFAHCLSCHQMLGENPVIFTEWAKEQLGLATYDVMRAISGRPTKMSVYDKECIHSHYLSEKKRLIALRDEGETGRIEFCLP